MKKWLIPALCALPFVGIAVWFLAGKNIDNLATLGLVLACPLSHVFLMRHDHHHGATMKKEPEVTDHDG